MRKFIVTGYVSIDDTEPYIDDFLDALGWTEEDGDIARAIQSEITSNLEDVLRGFHEISVTEEPDGRCRRCDHLARHNRVGGCEHGKDTAFRCDCLELL